MKKILSALLAVVMICTFAFVIVSCKKSNTGSVYYLNFKPEQDKDWQALAQKYTQDRKSVV